MFLKSPVKKHKANRSGVAKYLKRGALAGNFIKNEEIIFSDGETERNRPNRWDVPVGRVEEDLSGSPRDMQYTEAYTAGLPQTSKMEWFEKVFKR